MAENDSSSPARKGRARPAKAAEGDAAEGAETEEAGGPDLKKRELIDLAATRSGVRKKSVKPVVEAVLAVLGEALAEGRPLNLPGLGRGRVARSRAAGEGEVITVKLRRKPAKTAAAEPAEAAPDPLAEAAE